MTPDQVANASEALTRFHFLMSGYNASTMDPGSKFDIVVHDLKGGRALRVEVKGTLRTVKPGNCLSFPYDQGSIVWSDYIALVRLTVPYGIALLPTRLVGSPRLTPPIAGGKGGIGILPEQFRPPGESFTLKSVDALVTQWDIVDPQKTAVEAPPAAV